MCLAGCLFWCLPESFCKPPNQIITITPQTRRRFWCCLKKVCRWACFSITQSIIMTSLCVTSLHCLLQFNEPIWTHEIYGTIIFIILLWYYTMPISFYFLQWESWDFQPQPPPPTPPPPRWTLLCVLCINFPAQWCNPPTQSAVLQNCTKYNHNNMLLYEMMKGSLCRQLDHKNLILPISFLLISFLWSSCLQREPSFHHFTTTGATEKPLHSHVIIFHSLNFITPQSSQMYPVDVTLSLTFQQTIDL